MAFVYVYQDTNRDDCVKIGFTKERRIWDRIDAHIPCNPRPIKLRAAFSFETEYLARACESEIKEDRANFPRIADAGQEWYLLTLEQALAKIPWEKHGGKPYDVAQELPSKGRNTLNSGDCDDEWKLFAYVLAERNGEQQCKVCLTAYNWRTVEREFVTGNPNALSVLSRWCFADNSIARTAFAEVERELAAYAVHWGWFKASVKTVEQLIAQRGGIPFGRDDLDKRVGYTQYRRPVAGQG